MIREKEVTNTVPEEVQHNWNELDKRSLAVNSIESDDSHDSNCASSSVDIGNITDSKEISNRKAIITKNVGNTLRNPEFTAGESRQQAKPKHQHD